MIPARFNIEEPARARMLELARSLGWPRVIFRKKKTSAPDNHTPDSVGPGVVAWYQLAEQSAPDAIGDATRSLLDPVAAPVTRPAEPTFADGIHGPSKIVELMEVL